MLGMLGSAGDLLLQTTEFTLIATVKLQRRAHLGPVGRPGESPAKPCMPSTPPRMPSTTPSNGLNIGEKPNDIQKKERCETGDNFCLQ